MTGLLKQHTKISISNFAINYGSWAKTSTNQRSTVNQKYLMQLCDFESNKSSLQQPLQHRQTSLQFLQNSPQKWTISTQSTHEKIYIKITQSNPFRSERWFFRLFYTRVKYSSLYLHHWCGARESCGATFERHAKLAYFVHS